MDTYDIEHLKPTKMQARMGKFATKVYSFGYVCFAAIGEFVVKKMKIRDSSK